MIPLMKNAFFHEDEIRQALAAFILKANRFSMDSQCQEFEKAFAAWHGMRDAVLVNSGSSANLTMLQALKNLGLLHVGDKVGFSALTWATNVMPIIQLQFEPVPVDCNISTLNVMAENLEETLAHTKLKAFFATNTLGLAGDLDKIKAVCHDRGIIFLEDNCEALGTVLYNGQKTGTFGLLASFSFFVAHHLSTIEGGMILTNDEELGEMLRLVRSNGWDRNLRVEQQQKWRKKYNIQSDLLAKYTFYDLGYNFKPTEITGFLGLQQMPFLSENIRIREANYHKLKKIVLQNMDLIPTDDVHIATISSFAFPVICKNKNLLGYYLKQFAKAGVEVRSVISGNIQAQPFYKKYVASEYHLPNVAFINDCGCYFGNYPELTDADLETLKNCLSAC